MSDSSTSSLPSMHSNWDDGGVARVSRLTGFSRPTIYRAVEDLARPPLPVERVRHSGAGRKTLVEHDPRLVQALEALIDPDTRGDPMSPLRWTCKSTRQLARLLTAQGHPVSHMTVAQLLHGLRYSLQGNAKTKEGKQHPDRDAQFRYIQRQGKSFLGRGSAGHLGRYQEEGTGRELREFRARMATGGPTRRGRCT